MQKIRMMSIMALALAFTLGFGGLCAQASDVGKVHVVGSVVAIDIEGGNFTVTDRNNNTTKIYVNPATEFELEDSNNFVLDDDIPFRSLKVGDWVKVESYRINGELEADEVDVYRKK